MTDHWQGSQRLAISLASSGDHVLLVAGWGARLGVDLEVLQPLPDLVPLSRTVLHPVEQHALSRLPLRERAHQFLQLWTRKEALLKASGMGLSWDPRRINALGRMAGSAHHQLKLDDSLHQTWTVQDLDLAPGYLAALCSDEGNRPMVVHPGSETLAASPLVQAPVAAHLRIGST